VKLVHHGTGAVLATSVERADTIQSRLIGLLGRKELPEGSALLLEPCTSIHTFFMRFAIDVAFLSSDGRILRAIGELKPWRATGLYLSARLAVELPSGTLARTGTREGDRLTFID
jgi:uncharacterized membrane protein (UPF0127 family)